MKVLILHHHFKVPQKGGAIRSYYLAKALVDRGHCVVVMTAHNTNKYAYEMVDGIHVHWLPVEYENSFGFVDRSLSFLKFIKAVITRPAIFKDVDICYAISVPVTIGIAARWIKWRYHIPYIFEVGDLWPDAPIELGFVKNPIFKKFLFALERWVYRKADLIVSLSPTIKNKVAERAPGKKVHVLPNMADTCFYKPARKVLAQEEHYTPQDKFVVSYIGALGLANGLIHFLECALACQQANLPLEFLLCGDGAMLNALKNRSEQMGIKNLSFVPFQNRDGVREILNASDAVFVSYLPLPILETGSPNKYFDGLAAGKLLVINFGGWIRDEIEKNECGIFVNPSMPEDFVYKIQPFLNDISHLERYQRSARALAERCYSRKQLSDEFVSIVTNHSKLNEEILSEKL